MKLVSKALSAELDELPEPEVPLEPEVLPVLVALPVLLELPVLAAPPELDVDDGDKS